MQDVQTLVDKLFLIVSIVGTLLVLTEMVLRYFRKNICSVVGCKPVARYARFGDISILFIGSDLISEHAELIMIDGKSVILPLDGLYAKNVVLKNLRIEYKRRPCGSKQCNEW